MERIQIPGKPCTDPRGHISIQRKPNYCVQCGLSFDLPTSKARSRKRKPRRPSYPMDHHDRLDQQMTKMLERFGGEAVAEALYKQWPD